MSLVGRSTIPATIRSLFSVNEREKSKDVVKGEEYDCSRKRVTSGRFQQRKG